MKMIEQLKRDVEFATLNRAVMNQRKLFAERQSQKSWHDLRKAKKLLKARIEEKPQLIGEIK